MSFRDYPAPGKYVLCRFPESHAPDQPGTKIRPALIVGYGPEYGLDNNVVVLAYSTTQHKDDFTHRMVNVRDRAYGLKMPEDPEQGCFIDCGIVCAIPISHDYFPTFNQIGHLPKDTFNYICSVIQQFRPHPYTDALYLAAVYKHHAFHDDTQILTPYYAVEQSDPDIIHLLPEGFGMADIPARPQGRLARGIETCRAAFSRLWKATCG